MIKDTFWIRPKALSRRTALKAAGVSLALPFLESMAAPGKAPKNPYRMLSVLCEMGYTSDYFFPDAKDTGKNYKLSPYLQNLKDFKNDFTVFSGISIPGANGGHSASKSFLSCATNPAASSFKNTISLDQKMAQKVGHLTRFPTLPLSITGKGSMMAILDSGVTLPAISHPSELYKMMFIEGKQSSIEARVNDIERGKSILDVVTGETQKLNRKISKNDRQKVDEFLVSVREAEKHLQIQKDWVHQTKPKTKAKQPKDITDRSALGMKIRLMYKMVKLAFETDSTRIATLYLDGGDFGNIYNVPGAKITDGWHPLTHAFKDNKKKILKNIDDDLFKAFAGLLKDLKSTKVGGEDLLSKTMILNGSNLGHAGRHSNDNLPVLLAGGGFKHGQHLAFDRKNNYNQANLYLSMLHRMGINESKFASSSGTMKGLELI
ncbi:MAG: DUF1552 domain-containing protein [Lentisphaeraceae bacterium]|nr:DUF1552 domain-containing protein [Lentisphaeraceae bacterium]